MENKKGESNDLNNESEKNVCLFEKDKDEESKELIDQLIMVSHLRFIDHIKCVLEKEQNLYDDHG